MTCCKDTKILRVAVIKKCRKEDHDPKRSASKQKWCLYTKNGKKLLGRHPSKESAEKQEQAIQIRKHGSTVQKLQLVIAALQKESAWEDLPKGWTKQSARKFWNSLTGDIKHKVTKCMSKMDGKVSNPGAFCNSLKNLIKSANTKKEAGDISKPQKCKFCKNEATKAYVWAEGRAYIPVCKKHEKKAKNIIIKENNDKIEEVRDIPIKE